MSLFFRAAYRFGFKPWDSGVPPPELVAAVEGDGHLAPGKALDLGCGTGTNSIYMQQHGWEATGVDFVPRAVSAARRKAAAAGVSPRFIVGDVTRLGDLDIGAGYSLLLDLGCFHSIPDERRDAYVTGATAAAASGATMLLFGFLRGEGGNRLGPRGLLAGEVERRFGGSWEVMPPTAGARIGGLNAVWYRLRKR
jgi:SAM-dependent methyltransferase